MAAALVGMNGKRAPVMVEGWNEQPADFEAEEVHEMIHLPSKLVRATELPAAHRGIVTSRQA